MHEVDLAVAEMHADHLALHVDPDNRAAYLMYRDLGFVPANAGSPLATLFAGVLDPDEPPQQFMSKRRDGIMIPAAVDGTIASGAVCL
eukprot:6706022-Prymnesium_polylepis.1